jgi:hypothetical protein
MSLADKLKNEGSNFTRYNGQKPNLLQRTINSFLRTEIDPDQNQLHNAYSAHNNPSLTPRDRTYTQTPNSELPIPSTLNQRKPSNQNRYGKNNPSGKDQTGGFELPS